MKLVTVDIERPLPAIEPPTIGEQWVLVRFHGEPLGMLYGIEDGCSAGELGRLIARKFSWGIMRHLVADSFPGGEIPPLESLPTACPRHADFERPSVTVAVCTRNGADRLGECLDALLAIDYPADLLDLVVVDNAPSDDSTRALVTSAYPSIRYLVEPRPGLDWARNRAVLEARGDIVAFTDDDVSVDAKWVDAIARVFVEEPDADVVTGLVVPDEIDVESQLLFERYGGFGRGFERRYCRTNEKLRELTAPYYGGAGRFGTGANMAFRRRVFGRAGLFDPALDVGTVTNGGGDLEMFFRVLKEGSALVYEPAAIVRHRHRRSYEQLKTQLANNGVGLYAYMVRSAQTYRDERTAFLRLGVWWFWCWDVKRLVRSLLHPSEFPRDLILAELRGAFTGLRRYAHAQRQAAHILEKFGPQQADACATQGASS